MTRVIATALLAACASFAAAQGGEADQPPRERVAALLDRGNAALAEAMTPGGAPEASRAALREAVAAYGTVLAGGLDGPALRLNLASAEAQLGDRGRAALHLRAAGRLANEREDEEFSRAADAAFAALRPGEGGAWPPRALGREWRWALDAAEAAGVRTLAAVFGACWLLGWVGLGARIARVGPRTPWLAVGALLVAGCVSGGVLGAASLADAKTDRLAVIVRDGATLRAGPGDAFDPVNAAAGAGADVWTLDERDGWVKVRTASGSEGWLRADTISRLP